MYFLQCNKYMVKYPNPVSLFFSYMATVLFNYNNLRSFKVLNDARVSK